MLHVVPAGILSFPSGYTIANAIWFDGSPDELTFTPFPAGTGAGKKYTLSFWTKIIDTESTGTFFGAGNSGGDSLHIQTDWSSGNPFLNFNDNSNTGSNWLRRTGTRVLRDPTAWMHICFAVDNSSGGGLGGTANAARIYINGAEETSFASVSAHPPSSDTSHMTMQYEHVIGTGAGFDDYKSFYLAEFIIVDGQQLAPTAFGEYDSATGIWVPIDPTKAITDFGTNGAHLKFDSAALPGKSSTSTTTPTVSWLGSQAFTSGASGNTVFAVSSATTGSDASFGDAASNRSIVIAVGGARQTGGERNVSSVVVNSGSGNVSATRVVGRHGNENAQEFWTVPLASGTTGTITATFSGSMVPASITWWRVLDLGQAISTDTGQDVDGYTTLNATTIGQTGDVTFYALQDSGSSTGYSWSRATERAEHLNITSASSPSTLYSATAAEFVFTSEETHIETLNITGGSGNESSFAAVTFSNNNSFTDVSMGANNVVIDTCTDDSSSETTIQTSLDPGRAINQGNAASYSNSNLTVSGNSGHATLLTNTITDGASKYVWEVTVTKHDTNIRIGAILPGDLVSGGNTLGSHATAGQGWSFVGDVGSGNISQYRGTNMVTSMSTMADGDIYHIEFNNATGDVFVWRKAAGGSFAAENSGATVVNDTGANNGKTALAGAKVHLAGHLYQTSGTNLMTFNYSGAFMKAASSGYNPLTETFTGVANLATWNPLTLSGGALSEGNTKFSASGSSQGCLATIGASSGKYFCEARMDRLNNGTVFFGVKPTSASVMTTISAGSPWNQQQNLYFAYFSLDNLGGNIIDPETASAISDNSSKYTVTDGSTIGCVLDLDDYDVRWYKLVDAAWVQITNSTAAATTVDLYPTGLQWTFVARGSQSGDNVDANFGQRPFSATPPDGAVAMSTVNLPTPTYTDPQAYFGTLLYKGNGASTYNVIDGGNDGDGTDITGQLKDGGGTGSRWTPDWVWIKNRTGTAASHHWYDTVRGANAFLRPNVAGAENATRSDMLKSFDSGGFTLGADASEEAINKDNDTYVAWCWKAGGAPTTDNDNTSGAMDDGSVFKSGVVQSSYTPSGSPGTYPKKMSIAEYGGFSIVEYVGTGGNTTIPHGLDRAPEFLMFKRTNTGASTIAWHSGISVNDTLSLDSPNGASTQGSIFMQSTAPTATVVSLGSQTGQNGGSDTHILYSMAKTPGVIGIGTYTGNGSASGTYVQVSDGASGFRPAWLLIKRAAGTENFYVTDSLRNPSNPAQTHLLVDSTNTDSDGSGTDFMANGFKVRASSNSVNASGETYIYVAFAEHPFGGVGLPQARAR